MLEHYYTKAPRVLEVLAGLVLGMFGAFFGVAGTAVFFMADAYDDWSRVLGGFTCVAIAVFSLPVAWKLITGRGAAAGDELFSPRTLQVIGCLCFALAALVVVVDVARWYRMLEPALLGLACMTLAVRRRRRREQPRQGARLDS